MSFEFNNNYNISNVNRTVLNNSNGGNGSAGYFSQKREKQQESEFEEFGSNESEDTFQKEDDEDFTLVEDDIPTLIKSLFNDIFDKIKSIFKKKSDD